MNTAPVETKKPLGVRATADQHRLITEAAKRENRSVSNFVLSAALKAAESNSAFRPRYSAEQAAEIVKRAQEAFRLANPTGRSIVDELMAERREAAKYE